MITFSGHVRRVVLELISPGISDIDIDRVSVAVQFPYGRNLHVVPTFVIEACFPEIGRTCICIFDPEKFPGTIEAHVIGRFFFNGLGSSVCVFVSEKVGMHRCSVDRIDFGILPFFEGLSLTGKYAGA